MEPSIMTNPLGRFREIIGEVDLRLPSEWERLALDAIRPWVREAYESGRSARRFVDDIAGATGRDPHSVMEKYHGALHDLAVELTTVDLVYFSRKHPRDVQGAYEDAAYRLWDEAFDEGLGWKRTEAAV